MRICDAHIHLGDSEINRNASPEDILRLFKEKDLGSSLVFPFEKDIQLYHDQIISINWITNKIRGLVWIDSDFNYFKKMLTQNLLFAGAKYHGSYTKKPVTDIDFARHLELLNEKSAILLVHCGMFKDGDASSVTSYVHAIRVAARYPNIKVILGHMGGSVISVIKKVLEDINATCIPNVWLETSGITTPYAIELAVEKLGANRILFGSDYPWCSFDAAVAQVKDAQISEEEKEKIFYKNLEGLLQ